MLPAFLDDMSWEMAEVYGAITDQIMINLAHYFPFYDANDPLPSSAFEYQASMLAQMGKVNADTMRIIKNGLSDADPALKRTLEQAVISSVRKAEPELMKGVQKGILQPAGMPIVAPGQMRAFQLYYQQAAEKLNLVNTVMLESTQSAYQQAVSDVVSDMELSERMYHTQLVLDTAAGETVTGVSSWNQSLRHAMDKLKNRGITGFVDHAGRHWSAEAYVAMDIRTTVANTARSAVWETNQNFGNDLYSVSSHNGARPLCYPWQNKVISSTDNVRKVQDLDGNEILVVAQSETSYGEPAGLFGINCKHMADPFIPGVSVLNGHPQDEEENTQTYEESQEQRRLERKIREQKRDVLMAKAQGADEEEIKKLREKAGKTSEEIDEFCKSTGRARHRDREGVYTKREFPDKEKYDVTQFENEQKKRIEEYYRNGGAQHGYTFGTMTPKQPIAPNVANVASQATQAKQNTNTMVSEKLDAKNFPDSFNKKRTKTFVDTVNATEGTDPNVVKLFNTMGVQVNGAGCPVTISYTEENHAIGEYRTFYGKRVKLTAKVPKLSDPEYIRQEIGTTAHEWGHLFDHLNSESGVLSNKFNNGALPNALRNARPMSDRVKKMMEDAIRDGKAAEQLVKDAARAEIDALSAKASEALKNRDFAEYTRLDKQRTKLWKQTDQAASKASRKAHNGVNAIEDIYDAISGGTLRDRTSGMYGHGSRYYGHDPGGENAATETIANYCALALAYPDLFQMMAEEQPEIWGACGDIIIAMIGG